MKSIILLTLILSINLLLAALIKKQKVNKNINLTHELSPININLYQNDHHPRNININVYNHFDDHVTNNNTKVK